MTPLVERGDPMRAAVMDLRPDLPAILDELLSHLTRRKIGRDRCLSCGTR